jgi:uncharacterized membrane protein YgdD (TMEM256/DUF423 family)
MKMAKGFFVAAAILAFLAVAGGAFGAHGLKSRVSSDMIDTFQTGIQYQFYHALGLLVVAVMMHLFSPGTMLKLSGFLFIGGIVVFSGSLYVLVLTGIKWLGAITPIGGLAFLAGWVCLTLSGLRLF